ncbi:major facilitator superfamily domain-containing protein [Lipomyces kononenkoae]|uniref:Major facilitator superfamily domain-containing protein n=1 Tax=Lipomyces kononenkoae TaxID=34357 RepID=A0ACC3ST47_LIPKO
MARDDLRHKGDDKGDDHLQTKAEKDGNFVAEKGIDDSSDDDASFPSHEDKEIGLRTGKLRIPADWPPLASHEPKKYYFWNLRGPEGVDLDGIATQPSVFDDPDKAPLYQPLPRYENLHRVDHKARWTWREEIAVVRKIDLRIMSWCAIMFMALQLDRGNISQAVADNMLDDLKLNTNHYNNGNTIFKVFFLVSELPSQLVSKKLGPDRWIPIQMVSWSLVALSQFWLNSKASFYITRALLGALEGGFIADVCLYLSYFYTGVELPVRLAYFWAALTLSEIAASFMGFGILHMGGVLGREGWRWLFLVEGAITACVGIMSWLLMPPAPTKTASWFRGKDGWFTPREETIIVNRVLRDDPSKGDMHNRQHLNWQMFWRSLTDYDLWPIYIIGLMFFIPASPVDTYLTLTLRSIGFSTFQTILMVLPKQVLHLVCLLTVTYISQRYNDRTFVGITAQVWILITLIPLRIFGAHSNRWAKYVVTTLLLSYPSTHAVQVAWTSRNSNSVRTRTVSAALYNMFCQLGGIISSYVYRQDDRPLYHRGNSVLIGIAVLNVFIYIGTKVYYVLRNKRRDKEWNALSDEDKELYIRTTTDQGNKRLDFRFAH